MLRNPKSKFRALRQSSVAEGGLYHIFEIEILAAENVHNCAFLPEDISEYLITHSVS